jgi:processive 1,2-diacylglycerol beta-glucosyltransferase
MPRDPRILLLHCPAGGGHKAAALALAEAAERYGVRAEVCDALSLTPRWFARGYVEAHLKSSAHAPWAYGFGYRRLDRRHPVADRVRRRVDGALGAALGRFVGAHEADVVVATHFFPLSVLGGERLRGRLAKPLVGVVTDYAAHAFWAEPGVDRFCVAKGGAALDLARHGAPRAQILETGIPVRTAFGRLAPPALDPAGPLSVLVTSGGFGVGPLAAAVASFAGLAGIRLTVVCGESPDKVARLRALVAERGLDARVVGFEPDMPARFAEAHVVLGKPGGLTVSEALASGRPMALMGICPGQEQHNADWLTVNGAAVVVEPARAGLQIDWLRRSGELGRMARAARRLGAADAPDRVIEAALELAPAARAA